jgi:hypothetical protein
MLPWKARRSSREFAMRKLRQVDGKAMFRGLVAGRVNKRRDIHNVCGAYNPDEVSANVGSDLAAHQTQVWLIGGEQK